MTTPSTLDYVHVDVFSRAPFGGNSLPVFPSAGGLRAEQMQQITQELRHFEAIFLEPTHESNAVRVRVFDLFEELAFAGHPIIGAAAVLHSRSALDEDQTWRFDLESRSVTITTRKTDAGYFGLLDQGTPEFLGVIGAREEIASAFALSPDDLSDELPAEVVSTGLRYLVVPVRPGVLARARIGHDITAQMQRYGAQWGVLLDESALEIRHWNNDGIIEDVATGSAAGTIGAYRLRHGLATAGETFVLKQGRFAGRPSELRVCAEGSAQRVTRVSVGGDVAFVGGGTIGVSV